MIKNLKKFASFFAVSALVVSLSSINVFADNALENFLKGNDKDYSVILLVQQPIENTRYCVDPKTYDVGHTFLRLSDGKGTITYTGFYPKNSVGQKELFLCSSVKGTTNNDSKHDWNYGKKYKIDKSDYNDILNYINSHKSDNYNVLSYNCSTFAVKALKYADISGDYIIPNARKWTIPSPIDSTILAKIRNWTGYCPADLGADLSNTSHLAKDNNGNVREFNGGRGGF